MLITHRDTVLQLPGRSKNKSYVKLLSPSLKATESFMSKLLPLSHEGNIDTVCSSNSSEGDEPADDGRETLQRRGRDRDTVRKTV